VLWVLSDASPSLETSTTFTSWSNLAWTLIARIPLLPAQFEARELDMTTLDLQSLLDRRSEFEADWDRRLSYLVHTSEGSKFEKVWETVVSVLRQVEGRFAQ
jgi:hypothetical protein